MIEALATAVVEKVEVQPEKLKEVDQPEELTNLQTSSYDSSDSQYDDAEKSDMHSIDCINKKFADSEHPLTQVEFVRKTVETSDGSVKEGVFPIFDSTFDAQLDKSQYEQSDAKHFKEANSQLKEAIKNDPELSEKFTAEQLEQIEFDDTPDGYTWHHSEESGKLQLVDSIVHAQTGHTGGRAVWGGGSENR